MEPIILHCDMNAFYASVECLLNPELRDFPVAVGGSVESRHGIILAKNDHAKVFGIQTAETIWQAKQKCKDLIIVPPQYDQYKRFSALAREIYGRYTDRIEPMGLDENWLDVRGSHLQKKYDTIHEKDLTPIQLGGAIAHEIRETIKEELGVTISVGVSFNKIFAKLGSDMKKPDAVTVISRENFREKVWRLPASEMLGVGKTTMQTLKSYGIYTIGDLANTSDDFLESKFGVSGLHIKQSANGEGTSTVATLGASEPMKSIGHGTTTAHDLTPNEEVWQLMLQLVQDIGTKLRKHDMFAAGVAISIRDNELRTKEWQCQLPMPSQNANQLARAAFDLFEKNYKWHKPIRSVTVRAINLTEDDIPVQLDLFTDHRAIEKQEKLDKTIDSIRERFGKTSIHNATLFKSLKVDEHDEQS